MPLQLAHLDPHFRSNPLEYFEITCVLLLVRHSLSGRLIAAYSTFEQRHH